MEDTKNTVGTEGQGTPAPETGEKAGKTFTQEELNAIVGSRLHEERAKYADYETLKEKAAKFDAAEEAQKTELQKATEKAAALQEQLDKLNAATEARNIRDKVSAELGVPATLLSGTDEETCKAQAKAILEFAKPGSYPKVKDGGDPPKGGSASTRDQFAEWFKENLKR